jgi:SAM-dependent methyltransferase
VHPSAMNLMGGFIANNLDKKKHYDLLDFGSFINVGQTLNHRQLLEEYDVTYTGVDIQAGRNVDIQMTQPYKIPLPSSSQDVVLSGQVFEHIPFPWASILEIARVLRTGGVFMMTVPSRGHHHSTYDCWRYYPDSMRALAAQADLRQARARWTCRAGWSRTAGFRPPTPTCSRSTRWSTSRSPRWPARACAG